MDTEIEAKFTDVNHDEMRSELKQLGAKLLQPMRLMKRVIIENDSMKSKDAFIRVRDQGDKVTVTYKQFDELSLTGAKEIEIVVDDFDKTISLLEATRLAPSSFQESKRETWELDDATIELDEWPWLNPYIEIEGPNEKAVRSVADKLGFNWKTAVFGDVMAAYRVQYPHLGPQDTVGNLPEVKFNDELPEMFKTH